MTFQVVRPSTISNIIQINCEKFVTYAYDTRHRSGRATMASTMDVEAGVYKMRQNGSEN